MTTFDAVSVSNNSNDAAEDPASFSEYAGHATSSANTANNSIRRTS